MTDRVTGKIRNGEMELFLEDTYIGKADQQKIYQHVTVTDHPDAKYTECDDGGWC